MFSQRIVIVDSLRAWAFTPSSAVAEIHDNIELTPEASRMFYSSTPELNGTSMFNAECGKIEKTSVVLGCYAAGKIYLYDVTNEELAGIEEVTAAHEMLHAAYIRLSERERERINALLNAEAATLRKDEEFEERMSVYAKLPADDRINELHSVIGTEVDQISPELEQYYDRFFQDRAKIVAYYKGYRSIFERLQNDAEKLAASLDALAAQINAQVAEYNRNSQALDRDIEQFNSRARSQFFQTEAAFAAARADLVARSAELESNRATINQSIQRYQADEKRFDGLASQLAELNRSIDSSLAPSPEGPGE